MTELEYYNKDGKCTAPVNREHMCVNYQPDPFDKRYSVCFYRQDSECRHAMDLVCKLNGGEGFCDE
jgi:hypothetical protein